MREIIEEQTFVDACAALAVSAKRLDEILFDAKTRISEAPESGEPTDDSDIWGVPTLPWGDEAPGLVVYYAFTEKFIYLIDVQLAMIEA